MTPRKTTAAPELTDRQRLETLRDQLQQAIATALTADEAKQAQVAPLANQLRLTIDAIAAIPEAKAKSTVDDLRTRRAARESGTDVPAGAKRKAVSGAGRG